MTNQVPQVRSLSVVARVVMDMHALNNEGNESNRLLTRQVGIVTPTHDEHGVIDGYRRDVVNAISGDMNKHIFADAFRHIAIENGLQLSEPSRALDPARIAVDEDFRAFLDSKPPMDEVIDQLLTCALTDVGGIMVTGEKLSVKRKSAIEFGWTVGLPDITEVAEFIHARHAVSRLTRTRAERGADDETRGKAIDEKQKNTGQMIFNRPASSGVYGFISNLEVSAIAFNEVSQTYPQSISAEERYGRYRAAVLALGQTLLRPKGALTSTQLPHVVDVEGYIGLSSSAASAPMLSPLVEDYQERAQSIAEKLNVLHGKGAVEVMIFNGAEDLLDKLAVVVNYDPGTYLV